MTDPALSGHWGAYLLPFAILFLAALVQGVTGFAFGILSMAALTLLWQPQPANVVVTLLTVFSTLGTLYSVREGMRWLRLRPLLVGIALGMPLGTWVMVFPGSGQPLRLLVAVACVLVAVQNWRPLTEDAANRGTPRWLALAAGLASGFFSGSVSSGGPPILWYVYRQPWSREELKATCLAIFFVATAYKIVFWLSLGLSGLAANLITASRLGMAACLLPAVVLGTLAGVRLFSLVDRDRLRRLVCVLLLVMAAAIVATL